MTARLRLAPLAATVALVPSMSTAVDADPKDFVAALGQKTLLILNQKQLAPGDRERSLRVLFQGSFDIQQLSRFVLGRFWRTASEPQREEFTKLFESYIVETYSTRLGTFGGEDFKVTGARAEGEATLVASQILRPNNAPAVKIDWHVAKVGGEAKIGDVQVEGISLALTQRQEFAAVIQRNGGQLEGLLRLLRDRTKG
jgi:phospholipid transport system substrate-binding protein